MGESTQAGIVSRLQLFLSYRSVESRLADALREHLVQDFIGLVEPFVASDLTSVAAGTYWVEEIIKALRRAQLHIVICSPDSVGRPWINYEVGATGILGVPVIPLCHSGLLYHQLPVPLGAAEGGVLTDPSALKKVYSRVAALLGSCVPKVDFAAYAAELARIEKEIAPLMAMDQATGVSAGERIENPTVLCVTSPQFRELGYANQLQMVLDAFPKTIRHQYAFSSVELIDILLRERVDIMHIAAFVCPRAGDLYFSGIELPLGNPSEGERDVLRPEALLELIKVSRTRLVVLGASASLVLGALLVPVTNVIAARDLVSTQALASWVATFYKALASKPLADAFALATEVSQAPMKLYGQQRNVPALTVNAETAVDAR
jgi:hypothetical protein